MIQVNAMGDACPIPVVKTLNAMKELKGAGTVQTLVDNEIAVQNLTRLAESKGCSIETAKLGGLNGDADDRKGSPGGHGPGQMGRHAGGGNDNAEALLTGGDAELAGLHGGTVSGVDMHLIGDAEFLQHIRRFLHNGQITVTAHDNRYFFHLFYLPETFKKQSVPSGLQTAVIYTKTTTSNAQKKGICNSSLFSCLESHNTSRHSSILLTRQGLRYQTFHRLLSY